MLFRREQPERDAFFGKGGNAARRGGWKEGGLSVGLMTARAAYGIPYGSRKGGGPYGETAVSCR